MGAAEWEAFEGFARRVMAEERTAGMAVAVARHGRPVYSQGFGVRNVQTGAPATSDTVFGIASVSKSFTALGILRLVAEGKLGLDDPVSDHLPEFALHGADGRTPVRVRHLLSHTTGVPPLKRRPDLETYANHLAYLAAGPYQLLGDPGDHLSYCNDTFLVLGALIERLSGMGYREYMTERVIRPLGMARTTYDIRELIPLDNVTERYTRAEDSGDLQAHRWFELGRYEVGGGVSSTALDLLKYGQMYVSGGLGLVPGDLLADMWKPVYPVERGAYYCLALQVQPDHGGFTVVQHGGSQVGVSSCFGFAPSEGLVVAVLANVTGAPSGTVWLAALNTALGLPMSFGQRVEPSYRPSPEELALLTGVYQCDEGAWLRVFVEGASLMVENDVGRFPARMSCPDELVYDARHQQMRVRFHRDAAGRPWAAFSVLRMLRRAAEETT